MYNYNNYILLLYKVLSKIPVATETFNESKPGDNNLLGLMVSSFVQHEQTSFVKPWPSFPTYKIKN